MSYLIGFLILAAAIGVAYYYARREFKRAAQGPAPKDVQNPPEYKEAVQPPKAVQEFEPFVEGPTAALMGYGQPPSPGYVYLLKSQKWGPKPEWVAPAPGPEIAVAPARHNVELIKGHGETFGGDSDAYFHHMGGPFRLDVGNESAPVHLAVYEETGALLTQGTNGVRVDSVVFPGVYKVVISVKGQATVAYH